MALRIRLDTAEWHVTEARGAIERQRKMIDALVEAGLDLAAARQELADLETKLTLHSVHRDRIAAQLAASSMPDG